MKNPVFLSRKNNTFVKEETSGNLYTVNRFAPNGAINNMAQLHCYKDIAPSELI